MAEILEAILRHRQAFEEADALAERRAMQAREWLWGEIEESLVDAFRQDSEVAEHLASVEAEVAAGRMTPSVAARTLMAAFRGT